MMDYINIDNYVPAPVHEVFNDITIDQGVTINADNIIFRDTAQVINHGEIYATSIDIDDGMQIGVRNTGVISGSFNLGNWSNVYQIITNSDEMKPMNVPGGFSVKVENGEMLSFQDLLFLSEHADEISLHNSTFVWNGEAPKNIPPIVAYGEVRFFIGDTATTDDADRLNINDADANVAFESTLHDNADNNEAAAPVVVVESTDSETSAPIEAVDTNVAMDNTPEPVLDARHDNLPVIDAPENTNLPSIDGTGAVSVVSKTSQTPENKTTLVDAATVKLPSIGGTGAILVVDQERDPLHATTTTVVGDTVKVEDVREENFEKILGSENKDLADYLNNLRENDPDNKLLEALDSAANMDELDKILNDPVFQPARFNAMKLMTPVRIFDSFMRFGLTGPEYSHGAMIEPMYIFGSGFNMLGANGHINLNPVSGLNLNANMYFVNVDWSDDMNEFGALIYGGNVGAEYYLGNIRARAMVGMTYANFKSIDVYNMGDVTDRPHGNTLYASGDVGYRFNIMSAVDIIPFIGVSMNRVDIMDASESNVAPTFGMDISVPLHYLDINYDYGARITFHDGGEINGDMFISAWSVEDGIGGDASVGIVNDDFGTSYRLRIGGRVAF